jgi:hypothetical protein
MFSGRVHSKGSLKSAKLFSGCKSTSHDLHKIHRTYTFASHQWVLLTTANWNSLKIILDPSCPNLSISIIGSVTEIPVANKVKKSQKKVAVPIGD